MSTPTVRLGIVVSLAALSSAVFMHGAVAQAPPAIRSYKATMDDKIEAPLNGAPFESHATGAMYFQAPGAYRMESKGEPMFQGGKHDTQIYFADKPGIYLEHNRRTHTPMPPRKDVPILFLPDQIAQLAAKADLDLGTKDIDGKTAKGFEIDSKKMDPRSEPGPVEIWIDTATNLPLVIHAAMIIGEATLSTTIHNFEWNIELDPKLFDTTPPDGYEEQKPQQITPEMMAQMLAQGFGVYAGICDGEYPRADKPDPDVMLKELLQRSGLADKPLVDQQRSPKYRDIRVACSQLLRLKQLLDENPDAAYYGKTVTANEGRKVLVRWKREDGNYEVLYGDLSWDNVTPERLQELEK